MDIFTIGFFAVFILFMAAKYSFGFYMYRKSIYKVLYSGFTEYRMRRKSIEGMSQSYVLKEEFGPNRIIYHVVDSKGAEPSAFVTVFLTSGCYIIKVLKKNEHKKSESDTVEFKQSFILNKLNGTIYQSLRLPVYIIQVLPDLKNGKGRNQVNKTARTVPRSELLSILKELHAKSAKVLTEIDLNGIFMTLAHDAIENEKTAMQ